VGWWHSAFSRPIPSPWPSFLCKEYESLPRRQLYADRFASLKDEATKQQATSKTVVLTKNIQARFNDLQALIDRYLDDEAFASYKEALDHRGEKKGEAAKTKARGKRAAANAALPTGPGSPSLATPPATEKPKPATKPALPKAGNEPF
jgi:hypothetical protein